MKKTANMAQTVSETNLTTERQDGCQSLAGAQQTEMFPDYESGVTELYAVARKALAEFGGKERLRSAIDQNESYLSTISKCFNRAAGDRYVPIDWLAAFRTDDAAKYVLVAGINAFFGFDPPVQKRVVPPEDLQRHALEVIAEMDDDARAVYLRKLARKAGVRVEDVKL